MRWFGVAIACFAAIAGAAPAQSVGEQAAALNAIRQYALSYTKRLPNYTCTQTNRQTIRVPGETLTESKEFDCGSKQNTWFATPAIALAEGVRGASQAVAGETSARGEFGKLLESIFDSATGADLRWDRQTTLNFRVISVFAFRVPQSRGYRLVESGRSIEVPFKGFVYADYETGAVVRISMTCTDIPSDSEYTGADVTLDYRPARVAGQEIVVPAHYLAHMRMAKGEVTNEATFTAYRQFSADSTLKFDDEDQ
jgi:hypothetical protein